MVKKIAYRKKKKMYKVRRIPRNPYKAIHNFKIHHHVGTVDATAGVTNSYYGFYFKLNDLGNMSEYTNLFDSFRIRGIRMHFIPVLGNTVVGDAVGVLDNFFNGLRLMTAIDYNDASAPTSTNEVRQYDTCKVTPGCKDHIRYYRPQPTVTISEGSSYGLGTVSRKLWISTASNSTRWYGLKVAFEHPNNLLSKTYYQVESVIYMQFKNAR